MTFFSVQRVAAPSTLLKNIFKDCYLSYACRKCNTRLCQNQNPRIFSGIQPTGIMHLGNYLGAIREWVRLQNENYDSKFCIVDLHSITLPSQKLCFDDILLMTATLLACGIDPCKSIIYQQSQVLEHATLCWIFSCLTTLPQLKRLPQFKDKSSTFTNQSIPTGLLVYPLLQTADILLHKADLVPVGEDQIHHINLTCHLAKFFNGKFGETFPIPKALILDNKFSRIKSLRNPSNKMSKSEVNPKSRIELLDGPEVIREKIKKSLTDFTSEVYFDVKNRPGISNLMTIHAALSGKSYEQIKEENTHIDTGKYKMVLSDVIIEYLAPIRKKTFELMDDKQYLQSVLKEGTEKAKTTAMNTLEEVYSKIGFL